MRAFVKTEAFRNLNVGFSLDEGIATPDETFPVFYAERSIWRVDFIWYTFSKPFPKIQKM